jgi:hypothetical protein
VRSPPAFLALVVDRFSLLVFGIRLVREAR